MLSPSFRGFPSENKKKQVGICYIEVHHQPRPSGTGITSLVEQLHRLLHQCVQCPRPDVVTAAVEGSDLAVVNGWRVMVQLGRFLGILVRFQTKNYQSLESITNNIKTAMTPGMCSDGGVMCLHRITAATYGRVACKWPRGQCIHIWFWCDHLRGVHAYPRYHPIASTNRS